MKPTRPGLTHCLPVVLLLWSTCWLLTGCDVPGSSLTPQPANLIGLGNPGDGPNQACMLTVEALRKEPSEKNFELFFKERRAEVIWTYLYKYVGSENLQYHNLTDMNADAICKLEVVNKVLGQQNSIGHANLCKAIALYIDLKKQEGEFRYFFHFFHFNKLYEVWHRLQNAKNDCQPNLDLSIILFGHPAPLQSHILEQVVKFICNYCPHLVSINLSRNGLTELPDTFAKLTNLKELDLCENNLQELPITFSSLQLSCNLNDNPIQDAAYILFRQLLSTHGLDEVWTALESAKDNQQDTLKFTRILEPFQEPVQIEVLAGLFRFIKHRLPRLVNLDLSHNGLTGLPNNFEDLINLQRLDLNHNQLTTLPPTFVNLTNLEILYLEFNHLAEFPDSIATLTRLERLYLRDNRLTHLPPTLGDLKNLVTLDLAFNQLTALPDSIEQLTQLRSLNVDNNQLTALPPSFRKLNKLGGLFLHDNQLTVIPGCLRYFNNLMVYSILDHNPLVTQTGNLEHIGVMLTPTNVNQFFFLSLAELAAQRIVQDKKNYNTIAHTTLPADCVSHIEHPNTYPVIAFAKVIGSVCSESEFPVSLSLTAQQIVSHVHEGWEIIITNEGIIKRQSRQ